jgi:hypothetical protein
MKTVVGVLLRAGRNGFAIDAIRYLPQGSPEYHVREKLNARLLAALGCLESVET